jgi:hypothetical protein
VKSILDISRFVLYSWFAGGLQGLQKKSQSNFGACKLQGLHMGDFPKAVGGCYFTLQFLYKKIIKILHFPPIF